MAAVPGARCSVCRTAALEPFAGYAELPRVTSDAKPWPAGGTLAACAACGAVQKPATPQWRDETRRIYAEYAMYALSGQLDQPVFDAATGTGRPRAEALAALIATASPPADARVLDIGCGPGGALRTFARLNPGWRLNGFDLDDRNGPTLAAIAGFETLFTGALTDVRGRFDVVTLIHSLEHIPDPTADLALVRGLLAPGGTLLVAVPNVMTSPYDVLVADHRTHFDPHSLHRLVTGAGLGVLALRDDLLPKELSLLATSGAGAAELPAAVRGQASSARDAAVASLAFIRTLLAQARDLARAGPIGLFGTSISTLWLMSAIGDRVAFFVDEDPDRAGRRLLERPVLRPVDVPVDATVLVPLIPAAAGPLIARLGAGPGRWLAAGAPTGNL